MTDLTDLHDPHPKLFDAARITLRHLGDAELRSRRILRFELACLRELGLMPSLDQLRPVRRRVEPHGGSGVVRAGDAVACSVQACRPGQPHVVGAVGRRPGGDSRPGQPGQRLARAGLPPADASRRLERRSGRSSVTSWAIVPDSGPYWECDPMVRVDRNVRIALVARRPRPVDASIADRAELAASASCARLGARPGSSCSCSLCSAGCQSFGSPLAQWRAAYDGNLFKGPTKEEMADVSGPADSTEPASTAGSRPRRIPPSKADRHVARR